MDSSDAAKNSTKVGFATDPKTGEIVGGLNGLRELMRAKREQMEQAEDNGKDAKLSDANSVLTDTGRNKPSNSNSATIANENNDDGNVPSNQATKQHNRNKRRHNRKSRLQDANSTDSVDQSVKNPPKIEQVAAHEETQVENEYCSIPWGNIGPDDIVYAEVTLSDAKPIGVKLYALSGDGVVMYEDALFEASDKNNFCKAMYNIVNRNEALYERINVASEPAVEVYLGRDKKLVLGNNSLIYRDCYALKSANSAVFDGIRRHFEKHSRVSDDARSRDMSDKPRTDDTKSWRVDQPTNSMVDRMLQLNKIINKCKNRGVDAVDAMAAFILLNKATDTILTSLFGIGNDEAAAIINKLRAVCALGERRADGSFEIMAATQDEVKKLVSDYTANPNKAFQSAIRPVSVNGKMIVYDLGEMSEVKAADDLMQRTALFCDVTTCSSVKQLFDSKSMTVRLTSILKALSGDCGDNYANVADYDIFHSYVTKYMLLAGWFSDFPYVIFSIKGVNRLRRDVVRYIMTNLSWLRVMYSQEQMRAYADAYSHIVLDEADSEQHLRRAFIRQLGDSTDLTMLDESQTSLMSQLDNDDSLSEDNLENSK